MDPAGHGRSQRSRLSCLGALLALPLLPALCSGTALASHNDLRANAEFVPLSGNSSSISHNNTDTGNGGESPTSCDSDFDYGSTVWYLFQAPAAGTAVFRAIDGGETFGDTDGPPNGPRGNDDGMMDPVLAVFQGASANFLNCNDDDPAGDGFSSRLAVSVSAGTYAVQIGGFWLGSPGPEWPEEGNFTYTVDFTPTIPPLPPGLIDATIRHNFRFYTEGKKKGKTKVKEMNVLAEGGTSIAVSCSKGKCPFAQRTLSSGASKSTVDLKPAFGGAKLKPGTLITVAITHAGRIGKYFTFTIKRGKAPKQQACQINTAGAVTDCQ